MLPVSLFQQAVASLPLVSVDWILTNPRGEMLVGQRLNAPAEGAWFTPGGRIRKGEALAQALSRVAHDELGAQPALVNTLVMRGQLMGAWDHFYPDAFFSSTVPTHYVNLPHWAALSADEVAGLQLPLGEQHSRWMWMSLDTAELSVHSYVRPYVEWLRERIRLHYPYPIL